ncbi:MAG: 50S ribosomal protein L18 [Phycisphaerales bacterium]|nr:50S ribosomal protein L18 [Phycisphaerales bacterium]
MDPNTHKNIRRGRRKTGIRKRIIGMPNQPRLTIFRSNNHIYGQVVNDLEGRTIVSASSRDKDFDGGGGNRSGAEQVGTRLAAKAKEAGVSRVVFDRNGFRYHGRVKALADAARKGGLEF